MLLIRQFEETVEDLFLKGLLTGTVHTCSGQEAAAVGVVSSTAKGDLVTSNHRGHGHFIAKGGDPAKMMAEIFGKQTGYSSGRGGSQLMADYSLGFYGGNGIVGGSIALATGMALRIKMLNSKKIVVCFFGDGAVNQGLFHESLNMAALWKLPVLFACENNLYCMSTPIHKAHAQTDLTKKAEALGIRSSSCDGNDYFTVRNAAAECVVFSRDGNGPTFLELKTYRLSGHSRGDQRIYRSRQEELAWKKRDPITLLRKELAKRGMLDKDSDASLKKRAREDIRAAVAFAKKSPFPTHDSLHKGLFA